MNQQCTSVYECLTHTGRLRNNNEDDFLCAGEYLPALHREAFRRGIITPTECPALFGVFDGMGGEAYGEEASYLAAKTAAVFDPGDHLAADLTRMVDNMNLAVCDLARREGVDTGSTAVLIGITGNEAVICNVGDSRAYLFRDGSLQMLSVDHVIKLPGHPKGLLSQCLGMDPETEVVLPYIRRVSPKPSDLYLLCSDGLTSMLCDKEIEKILRMYPHAATQALLNAALDAGGRDNITILTLVIKDMVINQTRASETHCS